MVLLMPIQKAIGTDYTVSAKVFSRKKQVLLHFEKSMPMAYLSDSAHQCDVSIYVFTESRICFSRPALKSISVPVRGARLPCH